MMSPEPKIVSTFLLRFEQTAGGNPQLLEKHLRREMQLRFGGTCVNIERQPNYESEEGQARSQAGPDHSEAGTEARRADRARTNGEPEVHAEGDQQVPLKKIWDGNEDTL